MCHGTETSAAHSADERNAVLLRSIHGRFSGLAHRRSRTYWKLRRGPVCIGKVSINHIVAATRLDAAERDPRIRKDCRLASRRRHLWWAHKQHVALDIPRVVFNVDRI